MLEYFIFMSGNVTMGQKGRQGRSKAEIILDALANTLKYFLKYICFHLMYKGKVIIEE